MNTESSNPQSLFEINNEGISIPTHPDMHGQLLWQDIETIVAHKEDMMVYDTVVVSIRVKEGSVYHVSEEMPGFADFMDALARYLPLSNKGWYLEVAFPAFEPKPTLVFDRAGRAAEQIFRVPS